MKEFQEPFSPGHLKEGGFELQPHMLKCSICGIPFESLNPNAQACEKCRPQLHKLGQRRIAAKRKRKRAAEKLRSQR